MSSTREPEIKESWVDRAEAAFKEAVANAIADHARTGDPIAVWRDGKVVVEQPKQAAVAEQESEYGKGRRDGR